MSEGGGMVLLLMILGALMVYLLFSKGFWMDRFMQSRKWEGHDIEPEYKTNQEKIPLPTKKPKKPHKYKTKRVYKKRSKKK